jgi:hypothetical protein
MVAKNTALIVHNGINPKRRLVRVVIGRLGTYTHVAQVSLSLLVHAAFALTPTD